MKRALLWLLAVCMVVSLCGCKEKTAVADYQYMYDGIVADWNRAASRDLQRDDLFGYGEYLYNSYLLLFPRETPSTLKEYYFHWSPLIDVDGWAIYFTCQPNEENYRAFADGLAAFRLTNGDAQISSLYDDVHFSLPAYILQWSRVGEKWEVLEYILLDEANHTAVFVYTMSELTYIEENSTYTVTPSDLHFLAEDFSIYKDFENSTYDISFLDYLK